MSGQLWGERTYAQHGEDIVFCIIFDQLRIEMPSYLDIGAYHPVDISNTALLYERGSRGINVEPVPELLEEFLIQRPGDVNLPVAVGAQPMASRTLYVGKNKGLSSFDRDIISCPVTREISVRVVTIAQILRDCSFGMWPDLLSLDTEGSDIALLESLPDDPFTSNRPRVVCAELQAQGTDYGFEMKDLMARKGYRLFCRAHANLIFTAADLLG